MVSQLLVKNETVARHDKSGAGKEDQMAAAEITRRGNDEPSSEQKAPKPYRRRIPRTKK